MGKISGEITLLQKQDWDNATTQLQHELLVEIRDNGKPANVATATVRVIVTDADDIKPVFQRSIYEECTSFLCT